MSEVIDFPQQVQSRLHSSSAYKLELTRVPIKGFRPVAMNQPKQVAEFLFGLGSAEWPEERFLVLCLDTKAKLAAYCEVSKGLLNRTPVHPREIFRPAIVTGARSIIACHNHPSGDITPSANDLECTRQLKQAGELLEIPLTDHLIVGYDLEQQRRRWMSFREQGLIEEDNCGLRAA